MKVIIADDSPMIRKRIRAIIYENSEKADVSEADNGLDALHMIWHDAPDLVILDIRMPLLSGIDVLTRIQEIGVHPEVCILTSYDFPQYREKCHALGAAYFLDKNMEFDRIQEIVRSHNDPGYRTFMHSKTAFV